MKEILYLEKLFLNILIYLLGNVVALLLGSLFRDLKKRDKQLNLNCGCMVVEVSYTKHHVIHGNFDLTS